LLHTVTPSEIRLEASSFCQLRCPSCPTTTRAIHPVVGSGFLRLADFKTLVDDNPWLERIELSNYGEIFLNPHLADILEYAHERNVKISAANGVNLNNAKPEALEAVVKFGVLSMTCSIDGASPETYRVYRVRGDFDQVIANIRTINAHKRAYGTELPELKWQFVVFGHNEHELPLARQMAAELGMGFSPKLTWDDSFSPLRNPEFVREQVGRGVATRQEYEERTGSDYMGSICHQLWDAPQVNWDGKLLGCCRNFWGDFGGNAFRDGLLPAINGAKMRYARDMLLGRRPARDDIPCTNCEIYRTMCRNGNWLNRSPNIDWLKTRHQWLYLGMRNRPLGRWLIGVARRLIMLTEVAVMSSRAKTTSTHTS
jgi:hypothetical protein